MQQYALNIEYDHKAQLARKITVSNDRLEIVLHPVFYAYAQLAEKCCPSTKMTLVRMLMVEHPELTSLDAVATAAGLMVQNQTRLMQRASHEQDPFQVDVHFNDVNYRKMLIEAPM